MSRALARGDAANKQERIEGAFELRKALLRKEGEQSTLASYLQIATVRRDLYRVDGLTGQAIRCAEHLHGAEEIQLFDGRNNNRRNASAS